MAEKDTHSHFWFMDRRHFSLVIVLAFVILSAVTFLICYRHYSTNIEQTLKEERSTANLLSLILDQRFKRIVAVMESYSHSPLLLKAVRDKNVEKATVHLISLTKSDPNIESVIITDRQGTLWAAYPVRPRVLGKNFAYRDWYKAISKEWKPSISDVYLRVVAEKDLAVGICVPIFDETGKVIGILLNTQRTVGLNDLFKDILLEPGTSISVTDRKGQIVYSSRYYYEKEIKPYPFQSGMNKATAAKNNTFAVVDDPDLGGIKRYISFAQVGNIGWTVLVGRDKRSILLSGSAYFIQVAAIAFLLFLSIVLFLLYSRKQVMTQQILKQLQAEKIIRAGEEKMRALSSRQEAILAAVPELIMEVNNNKIYTWANSAGIEFFGEDVIGKEAAFYFEGEQDTYDRVRPLFNGVEDIIYLESWQRRRDGEKRLLGWWCRVLTDESGQVTGALSSARDITERKAAEVALQAKNEEIKTMSQQLLQTEKLATMGELASSIAHELNNPLTTVSLSVESLIAKTPVDDPRQQKLEIIGQEVERMGTLVTNLLQFSRRSQPQISTVNVCDEIEKTLELIHYQLRKRNIGVERKFEPGVPPIHADRQQLRQLFLNLFMNASDAMPEGGTLTISVYKQGSGIGGQGSDIRDQGSGVGPTPEPRAPTPAFVVVEIADTGVGIPPEILPKVLEPFYTTKPEGKGTGLGLPICRRITEGHGGTLNITSEGCPGKGTRVCITLPFLNGHNTASLKDE